MRFPVGSALATVCVLATTVRAQTCLGAAGFEGGRWRGGASYASLPSPYGGSSGSELGAQLALGSAQTAPFAIAGVSRNSDGVSGDPAITTATVTGGYRVPIDVGALCPLLSVEHHWIPDQTVGAIAASGSANQVALGAAIGFPVKFTPAVQWRPTGALSYESRWVRSSLASGGLSSTSTSKVTYAEFEGGIGFVVNLDLTIRASYVYDFNYSGGAPSRTKYVLGVSINFGPGSKTAE